MLDNLHPQVHPEPRRPTALDGRVELVHGDVTSAATVDELVWWAKALKGAREADAKVAQAA